MVSFILPRVSLAMLAAPNSQSSLSTRTKSSPVLAGTRRPGHFVLVLVETDIGLSGVYAYFNGWYDLFCDNAAGAIIKSSSGTLTATSVQSISRFYSFAGDTMMSLQPLLHHTRKLSNSHIDQLSLSRVSCSAVFRFHWSCFLPLPFSLLLSVKHLPLLLRFLWHSERRVAALGDLPVSQYCEQRNPDPHPHGHVVRYLQERYVYITAPTDKDCCCELSIS